MPIPEKTSSQDEVFSTKSTLTGGTNRRTPIYSADVDEIRLDGGWVDLISPSVKRSISPKADAFDFTFCRKAKDFTLGYFVGVKTILLNHIEMVSKIQILCYFRPWAILSVNHRKKHLLSQALFSTIQVCQAKLH